MVNEDINFSFVPLTEIVSCDKFICDNVQWQFTFNRARPEQFMLAPTIDTAQGSYYFDVSDFYMTVNFVKPMIELHNTLQSALNDPNKFTNFQIKRNEVVTCQIIKDNTTFNWANTFNRTQVPAMTLMKIVPTVSKSGNYKRDPYFFPNCSVKHVQMMINGENVPQLPYSPNFKTGEVIREFNAFYDNLSIRKNSNMASLDMTVEHFIKGSTIWVWDLSPDSCAMAHSNHTPRQGVVSFTLHFDDPLPENMTCVVMAIYHDGIIIDMNRKPSLLSTYGARATSFG